MDGRLLGIYLNDHLAGSRAGLDLARRTERENRGNPLGDFLATLITELEQDREVLQQVMRALNVSQDTLKQSSAWLLERLGRLKFNGRVVRYSPLSRLLELEGLCLGSQGRRAMWRALKRLAQTQRSLVRFDFEALVARAEMQWRTLERWRLQAADTAFANARFVPSNLIPAELHGR